MVQWLINYETANQTYLLSTAEVGDEKSATTKWALPGLNMIAVLFHNYPSLTIRQEFVLRIFFSDWMVLAQTWSTVVVFHFITVSFLVVRKPIKTLLKSMNDQLPYIILPLRILRRAVSFQCQSLISWPHQEETDNWQGRRKSWCGGVELGCWHALLKDSVDSC